MRRQNQKEMVEWRALASPIVSAWERETLPYPLFYEKSSSLLFSLSGSVCRALLLSPEHLPVDIHSIQPPPPPIVCECLIPFYFYFFLFFKKKDVVVGYCFQDIAHLKQKKSLGYEGVGGLAIVFRYPLIHFHPTMSHILCCSKCFISSRCYYNIGRARYPHFVISSSPQPTHTHPPPKSWEKENVLGIKFYGDSSVCTQVRCQVRHTHAIRIVCLIVWIFIYTSILYTVKFLPADDHGENKKKREYPITPIRVFSEKDKTGEKYEKKPKSWFSIE